MPLRFGPHAHMHMHMRTRTHTHTHTYIHTHTHTHTHNAPTQATASLIESGEHNSITDFDEHVANVSRDWFNHDLTTTIKQHLLPSSS